MGYTNKIERQFIDEGINIILNGHCILSLALDPTKSPEDVEYRKRVFPELAAWMRKVKECEYLSNTMTVESPVKAFAIKKMLELREAHKPKTTVKSAMKTVAKPILKVKKAKKVKTEEVLYTQAEYDKAIEKAVAKANSRKDNEFKKERFEYQQIIDTKDKELDVRSTVINQLIANNIKTVQAFGVNVTAQSLGL